MKFRIFRLSIVAVVTLIGFVFVGAMVSAAAPAEHTRPEVAISPDIPADTEIQARRLISIPYFGISDTLQLSQDGREITVTGPGECEEGGETFRIRVFVEQNGHNTQAKGRTEDTCDNVVENDWQAVAKAQGKKTTFVETNDHGEPVTRVRAMIVIFNLPTDTLVAQWEKDVTLEMPE